MTTARLLGAPSEGHGLVSKHTDRAYRLLTEGREAGKLVVVAILEPVAVSQRKTAKGMHRTVTYEAVRLEPVIDGNQAAELQFLAQNLYEQRTSNAEPRYLPLGFSDMEAEEKRRATIEAIEDWAKEADIAGHDLEVMWRDHFGIAEGSEYSYGDQGVPGDYRKAGAPYLLEFGYAVEALSRETKLPHEEREEEGVTVDDGTEPEPAGDDGDTGEPPAEEQDEAAAPAQEERHLSPVPPAAQFTHA